MKQALDMNDLSRLNDKTAIALHGWSLKKLIPCKVFMSNGWPPLPLLTVGQLIEFLELNTARPLETFCMDLGENEWHVYSICFEMGKQIPAYRSVELIEALWQATLSKLEYIKE